MKISKKKLIESVLTNLSMYVEAIDFKTGKDGSTINFEDYNLPAYGSCKGKIISTEGDSTTLVGTIQFTNYSESPNGKKFDSIKYHLISFGRSDISSGQEGAENLVNSIYNKSKTIISSAVKQAEKYKKYVPEDLVKDTLDGIISMLENEFGMYIYVRSPYYTDKYSNKYTGEYEDRNAEYLGVFGKKYLYL